MTEIIISSERLAWDLYSLLFLWGESAAASLNQQAVKRFIQVTKDSCVNERTLPFNSGYVYIKFKQERFICASPPCVAHDSVSGQLKLQVYTVHEDIAGNDFRPWIAVCDRWYSMWVYCNNLWYSVLYISICLFSFCLCMSFIKLAAH